MHGLLMDDFRCHQIKMVTETNILEKKNKEVALIILANEMDTDSVF